MKQKTVIALYRRAYRKGGQTLLNSQWLKQIGKDSVLRELSGEKNELQGDPRSVELETILKFASFDRELAYRLALRSVSTFCRYDASWNNRIAVLLRIIGYKDFLSLKVDRKRLCAVMRDIPRVKALIMAPIRRE